MASHGPSARQVKASSYTLGARLQSIAHDAAWLEQQAAQLRCPIFANLRNGAWYTRAPAGSAYFKSSDGHVGHHAVSATRLNLALAAAAAQHPTGAGIVDTTRRGKSWPDSIKTVAMWCAVLNETTVMHVLRQTSPEQVCAACAQAAAAHTPGSIAASTLHAPEWLPPSEQQAMLAAVTTAMQGALSPPIRALMAQACTQHARPSAGQGTRPWTARLPDSRMFPAVQALHDSWAAGMPELAARAAQCPVCALRLFWPLWFRRATEAEHALLAGDAAGAAELAGDAALYNADQLWGQVLPPGAPAAGAWCCPIVFINPSAREERHISRARTSLVYVQGAGDDEEAWAPAGFTARHWWAHAETLMPLLQSEPALHSAVIQIGQRADELLCVHIPPSIASTVRPWSWTAALRACQAHGDSHVHALAASNIWLCPSAVFRALRSRCGSSHAVVLHAHGVHPDAWDWPTCSRTSPGCSARMTHCAVPVKGHIVLRQPLLEQVLPSMWHALVAWLRAGAACSSSATEAATPLVIVGYAPAATTDCAQTTALALWILALCSAYDVHRGVALDDHACLARRISKQDVRDTIAVASACSNGANLPRSWTQVLNIALCDAPSKPSAWSTWRAALASTGL